MSIIQQMGMKLYFLLSIPEIRDYEYPPLSSLFLLVIQ
ncbi:unnamed protein product [Haemonchus placei]|uniref:Uncharacterized protein n=1 Tax=Haemonchus placei TaxID=6290 RepID=A0A0N4WMY5_HAEPC|nr:unnamed protein product [Haemonchus placei]